MLYIQSMKKVREKFDSNKTIIDKIEEFVDNYFDEDLWNVMKITLMKTCDNYFDEIIMLFFVKSLFLNLVTTV